MFLCFPRVAQKLLVVFLLLQLLLLSTVVAETEILPSDVGHKGLPACDRVPQSSGYLDIPGIGDSTKHFFYWLFAPRNPPPPGKTAPVVLWLTGGPGCSSGIGLGVEIGPCLTNEKTHELVRNPYGWNNESYLLFVDQPIGTGYSYSEDKRNMEVNEEEVAEDMYQVLQLFAKTFKEPSISERSEFFITGESYAGHYIPAIAYRVVLGNQRGDGHFINLQGIAIGNGWTNPLIQYQSYATYAYYFCQQALGKPCVSHQDYQAMVQLQPRCVTLLEGCMNASPNEKERACDAAGEHCTKISDFYDRTGLNTYDIRRPCDPPGLCYPMEFLTIFFNRQEVKAALGVHPGVQWETCSFAVNQLFMVDHFQNFDVMVSQLLNAGIRVLIYVGEMDFNCNFMGNLAWVKSLQWNGQQDFQRAPDNEFRLANRWAGTERQSGLLSFVRVYNAGHMVPMDQPEVSLYMLHRFLHGQSMINS